MWIFYTGGYVSAVEHRDDPELLMVRARDRESLENMVDAMELAGNAEGTGPTVTRDDIEMLVPADYPWRVTVPRGTFALWLQFEALNGIGYDSHFKEALRDERGEAFYKAAMEVWQVMLDVEDTDKHWRPKKAAKGAHVGAGDWWK